MNANTNGQKLTILYARLSKGDELLGESNSISNQRKLLEEYAERNGFTPHICITDDDFTGTNFARPGWNELIERVDNGEVGTIILKSLDRMARNYLQSGLYREMFAEKGIRLIAMNDGIDTFEREDDFIPFRELMAEHYARDTSKKIKSVIHKKGRDGIPLGTIPPNRPNLDGGKGRAPVILSLPSRYRAKPRQMQSGLALQLARNHSIYDSRKARVYGRFGELQDI